MTHLEEAKGALKAMEAYVSRLRADASLVRLGQPFASIREARFKVLMPLSTALRDRGLHRPEAVEFGEPVLEMVEGSPEFRTFDPQKNKEFLADCDCFLEVLSSAIGKAENTDVLPEYEGQN